MSLNKFFITILTITFLASFYVHQQVKIYQLAYQGQDKLVQLSSLVEENKNLRYNINRKTSLISMAGVWQDGDFEWPEHQQLVNLATAKQSIEDEQRIEEPKGLLARFFRLRSQAEATPVIKPR